jgi:hypothetical protein
MHHARGFVTAHLLRPAMNDAADNEFPAIQRGRMHAYDDLPGLCLWHRHIAELKDSLAMLGFDPV